MDWSLCLALPPSGIFLIKIMSRWFFTSNTGLLVTAYCCLLFCTAGFSGAVLADFRVSEIPVPAAAGSTEPNLAKGPDGTIVLSWLEPAGEKNHGVKVRLRFSSLEPSGWSAARTVAEGKDWFVNWADFPSVVPVSDTLWAAHWLVRKPGGTYSYDVAVALSNDAGASWSEAITPHRDNTATEHGFVSLFPASQGAGVIWLDGRNTASTTAGHAHGAEAGAGGMTLRSAVITAQGEITQETEMDSLVCDCCQTSVAIARQGPVVVYRNRTEAEIRDIYVARSIAEQWQAGQPVHADGWEVSGCPVNGPSIAAAGDKVVVAWFTMAGDIPRVRFAQSDNGGETFGPALDIAEHSPSGRVDVALLDNGNAVVSWLDETNDGKGVIRIRIIYSNGIAGPAQTVAGMELSRPAGFPQLVADGDSLIASWTDTLGDTSTIRSVRLTGLGRVDLLAD